MRILLKHASDVYQIKGSMPFEEFRSVAKEKSYYLALFTPTGEFAGTQPATFLDECEITVLPDHQN